ncbi:hypothetical protein ACFWXK_22805 [Streptomyces sp. NPDC059070]|uniref:hypothetical protein n=1 Tax=Streptomyces sp. NPDC059070 TaxID=3346713 RepID=UPI0036B42521
MTSLAHVERRLISTLLAAREAWAARQPGPQTGQMLAMASLLEDDHTHTDFLALLEDGELAGILTLVRQTPLIGWTAAEQQEPALTVTAAITHPDRRGERLARLASPWLSNTAAHLPGQLAWVRCAVPDDRLAAHLRTTCGWEQVRWIRSPGLGHTHLLQRRAEPVPRIERIIASNTELTV